MAGQYIITISSFTVFMLDLKPIPVILLENSHIPENSHGIRVEGPSIRSRSIRLLRRDILPETRGLEATRQRSSLRRSPFDN